MNYKLERTHISDKGGRITITICSSRPIEEKDFPILGRVAAQASAEVLVNVANFMRPFDTKEISF